MGKSKALAVGVAITISLMLLDTAALAARYEDKVTVAICQLATIHGDLEKNLAKMEEWTVKAAQGGANFVIFPEGALTGIWGDLDYPKLAQDIPQ